MNLIEEFNMNLDQYLNPDIRPISDAAVQALENGTQDPTLFLPFEHAIEMMNPAYHEVETGYCLHRDGSACVNVLTDMPGVTPAMWHWWFGWHGEEISRYRLWHPKDHLAIQWQDKVVGQEAYIDRVSLVEEYLGKDAEKIAIHFQRPSSIGLPDFDGDLSSAVYIVAKAGPQNGPPVYFSRLIHQIRPTPAGAEMRSRFWLGGQYITARDGHLLGIALSFIARRVRKTPEQFARDLLIHCAEEMAHLATFLPKLYADQN